MAGLWSNQASPGVPLAWAAPHASHTVSKAADDGRNAAGLGGADLRTEGAAPGLGSLMGLGAMPGGAPGPQDMNAVLAAMHNPAFQQMMQTIAAQPGAIEMLARANPHLGTMMDADPRLRCVSRAEMAGM